MPGSPGPTIPASSSSSISRAARGYPILSLRCSSDVDSVFWLLARSMAESKSESPVSALEVVDDTPGIVSLSFSSISSLGSGGEPAFFQYSTIASISSSLRYAPCTLTGLLRSIGLYSISPFPSSFSAPFESSIVRLSTCDITEKLTLEGKFAFMSPVTTSTDGLCVATTRCTPVALPSCASLTSSCSTSLDAVSMRSASSSTSMRRYGIFMVARWLNDEMFLTPAASSVANRSIISFVRAFRTVTAFSGSTTTGEYRCGIPWYGVSSTLFGSIITIRTSIGVRDSSSPATIVFMHTLFPDPVAPATRVCGMVAKSAIMGSPPLPMPIGTGSAAFCANCVHSGVSIMDRRFTGVGVAFGTSMPTTDAPGTTDSNLMFGHLSASARSFSRLSMVSTLTLCAVVLEFGPPPFHPGLSPYIVMVGPILTWSTVTSTPCWASDSSISLLVSSISDADSPPLGALGMKSVVGRCQVKSFNACSSADAAKDSSISLRFSSGCLRSSISTSLMLSSSRSMPSKS